VNPRDGLLGPGAVLQLIRSSGPITRAELIDLTGLGRSTVSQRVEALLGANLIVPGAEAPSTGGRRPATLVFNQRAGLVLAADLGATHSRLAVSDLSAEPLAETTEAIEISRGPEPVLAWIEDGFRDLLDGIGRLPADVRAIGIGVPGPVEFDSGRPVNPPIMPGWDGYDIPRRLAQSYPLPILVDNDVNIMALGEHHTTWSSTDDVVFIKVGTGIGCGIITEHQIYRGRDGAAGDIGHIRISGHDDVICECGNSGCLEIVAGGRALVREARELGLEVDTSADVVALVRAHNVDVVRLVRQAGRYLGEVLAGLVNALNPSVIIIGGDLARAHEQLFAGLREVVYQRSTPLATKHLQIVRSALDDRAGIIGASVLAIEHVLSPAFVDRQLVPVDAAAAGSRALTAS
jgi:predicted NBD/HSP70 family sugar kinase